MADIFGRQEQVYGGGLTSDASWMFWGGMPSGGLGMLVTQMGIQYQQPVRRIYEIGPWISSGGITGQPVYYVAGRPEGNIRLSRIAGPVAALGGFYRTYGNICSTLNSLFFVAGTGCIGGVPAGGTANGTGVNANANFGGVATAVPGPGSVGVITDPYLGWLTSGVVLTSIGLSAQAQDMLVAEEAQMMFVSLRLFTSTSGAGPGSGAVGQAGVVVPGGWTEI